MKNINIVINDLNSSQRSQIYDLLTLVGIPCTSLDQPSEYTYSIEIGLNKTNARLLEGILGFIITYINTGETNEYINNK
jgi:hypothetical protein